MNRQIVDLIATINDQINNSDQLCVSSLSNKLKKCSSAYPQDKTIGALSRIISSFGKNNDFITKKSFKELYASHYTNNTAMPELFSNELDIKIEKEASVQPAKNKDIDLSKYKADPLLENVLSKLLLKDTKVSLAHDVVKKAEEKVLKDLNNVYRPSSVKAIDSNSDAIVVLASFESPKGMTEIFIPLTKNLEGNVFIGNKVVSEINEDNIKNYILKNAGQKIAISSKKVLSTIESSITPKQDRTELAAAAIKVNNSKLYSDGIVGVKFAESTATIVELPKSNEFKNLEEKFASPLGIALENFGEKMLQKAAQTIQTTLNQINSPALKINLLKSSNDSLIFNVLSKSGKTFTVPVKVSGSNCLSPDYAVFNGGVQKLDKKFESKLASSELDKASFKHVANLAVLNSDQLLSLAKQFSDSKEFEKMATVLEVLKDKDIQLYKNAYKFILGDIKKEASINKCSKLVERKNSIHKICEHTGLPENKVYQDKDGNCRPLYRKELDNMPEKGFYMTSKILG